jgi:hypothetical protein
MKKFNIEANKMRVLKFQHRAATWCINCFGIKVARDVKERSHRFVEESMELAQAAGCSKEDVLKLVDYVYSRPIGVKAQEAGAVLLTFSLLCSALNLNVEACGEIELVRVNGMVDRLREKFNSAPKDSPLPQ